jgi:hypothetical protein
MGRKVFGFHVWDIKCFQILRLGAFFFQKLIVSVRRLGQVTHLIFFFCFVFCVCKINLDYEHSNGYLHSSKLKVGRYVGLM